jgi:protein gp37
MRNTKVEYVDHTFSPWHGCSKKSAGCRFCFAADLERRWGNSDLWRRRGPRRIVSEQTWRDPEKWNLAAQAEGRRHRILNGTMCDVFEDHPAVTGARARLFGLIEATPWLIWAMYTKRPENVPGMVPWGDSWPDNAWLVTSVENQETADERIPLLLAVTGAPLLGLSVEPLIGRVSFQRHDLSRIGWALIGGESGAHARPMHPQWALDTAAQLGEVGVARWYKQWGTWGPADWSVDRLPGELTADYKARAAASAATHLYAADADEDCHRRVPIAQPAWARDPGAALPDGVVPLRRWGKAKAGHLLGGREIQELPAAAYLTPDGQAA